MSLRPSRAALGLLLLSVACGKGGNDTDPGASDPGDETPPLCGRHAGVADVGSTWVWASSFPNFPDTVIQHEVASIDAETGKVVVTTSGTLDDSPISYAYSGSIEYLCTEEGLFLVRSEEDTTQTDDRTQRVTTERNVFSYEGEPLMKLPYELGVGDEWTFPVVGTRTRTRGEEEPATYPFDTTGSGKVLEEEEVTTEAGTFTTYKLVLTSGTRAYNEWYALDVGQVKSLEGESTKELTSYAP